MLRLLAVCGLLTITLSILETEFDFGGDDESAFEDILREHGFSEENIELILLEDREIREMEDQEGEEYVYVPWDEAKGYDECEEFKWWRVKYGKSGWKEEEWADRRKQWMAKYNLGNEDVKDDDVVDKYKLDSTGRRAYHGQSKHYKYHSKHKKSGYHGKKKSGCSKPKPVDEICAEYECPPFEKLNASGCGYEMRRVLSANWVVTPIDTSDMKAGYTEALMRLLHYRYENNDQGALIPRTVPVINRWFLNDDNEVEAAQIAFYISSEFQDNPPTPSDDLVIVEEWGDIITYGRAFGGDRDKEYYEKQMNYLKKALEKEGITPYPMMEVTAGFARPGRGRQRKEVMLVDADSM